MASECSHYSQIISVVVNVSKCQYAQEEVVFLGHRVNKKGIAPDQTCVKPILQYLQPLDVTGLRRFLGMVPFYRRNISHAADIQRGRIQSIITTSKKNDRTLLNWTEDAVQTFNELKRALAQATLLAHPSENAELILCTDASDTCIGGALQQLVEKTLQPLAFFSRKLSSTEMRYSTYDRELLAIISAIRHFSSQREGRKFIIYTDDKPLQFAFHHKSDKASPRVLRQLEYITQFTTNIRYLPGSQNVPADALSRVASIDVADTVPYEELAAEQERDEAPDPSLQLQKAVIPGTKIKVYCDVSAP